MHWWAINEYMSGIWERISSYLKLFCYIHLRAKTSYNWERLHWAWAAVRCFASEAIRACFFFMFLCVSESSPETFTTGTWSQRGTEWVFSPYVDINNNNNNNDFSKVNDVSKGAEMVLIEGIYPTKIEKHTHTLTSTMSTLLVTCEKQGKKKIRERSPLNFNTVQAKQK